MTKVNCNVESCSYNIKYECHANGIIVSPKGGMDKQITCCGSYLNKTQYSNMASTSILKNSNEYVQCKVGDCNYYENGHCTLSDIQIKQHHEVQSYIETYCGTFQNR